MAKPTDMNPPSTINREAVAKHIARIGYITTTWTSRPDDDAFNKGALAEMIEAVEEEADALCKLLFINEVRDLITAHAGGREFDDLQQRWEPYSD